MPQRCATLAELLIAAPEFLTTGGLSTGVLTFASNPAPGDVITLATQYGVPLATETYVADTDFVIGVDAAATAGNFATALSAGALAIGTAAAGVVTVISQSTGPIGVLTTVSSDASMVWTDATLLGGDDIVNEVLSCTCSMINLECWGSKASCGSTYLAAHFLATMGFGTGEVGPISSKKIKDLSLTYAISASSDAEFGSTRWGRLYTMMRDTLLIGGLSTRGPAPGICSF
jgi:hypothetical protein